MLINPDEHQLRAIKNLDTKVIMYLKECLLYLDQANRQLEGVQLNRSQGAALAVDYILKLTTENR